MKEVVMNCLVFRKSNKEETTVWLVRADEKFVKIPCEAVSSPFSVFECWVIRGQVTIEEVSRHFELGNNKFIREVGILTSPALQSISKFTRETDPKRVITEDFLIFSKNKKCTNPICVWFMRGDNEEYGPV